MKKIYILTIVISIAFIIPGCIVSYPVLNVLSSIGCSGIAVAIMAIFIEKHTKNQQETVKKKARKAYFQELHGQLKMMLERIVWFDERMDDAQFDWGKNPIEYSSLKYMIWATENYPEYVMSYNDIRDALLKIAGKYNLEHQENMSTNEKIKVYKMFNILGVSGTEIVRQIEIIDANKLVLDMEDYMSLDDISELNSSIRMAVFLMMSNGKNYGVFVSQLLSAYDKISSYCDGDKSFRIGVHGNISWKEL